MSVGSSVFSDLAVHHVEFHVTDAVWAARELAGQYGFAVVGSRQAEDHVSVALRQGSTVLVVTEGLTDGHPASLYVQQHGDGVADLALRTADARAAFEVGGVPGRAGGGRTGRARRVRHGHCRRLRRRDAHVRPAARGVGRSGRCRA